MGQNNAAWSWFGVQDFKKSHVWGKAHALALNAHRVAGQIRGASYLSFSELEYHLIASRDLGLIRESDFVSLLTQVIEVRRMIHGLLNRMAATEQVEPVTAEETPSEI